MAVVRLAAAADLHCRTDRRGVLGPMFARAAECADVLVLCGDLTDFGTRDEARLLAHELQSAAGMPMVGVLGNHDFESDDADAVRGILCEAGLNLLDGETFVACRVGFAGAKGFAGGFGRAILRPFGEPGIKAFAQEAVDEACKLERALAQLSAPHRVALTHYSPIEATVTGEAREIFPYLGTSRLEDAVHTARVSLALHGHAHYGTHRGQTSRGVPVYNVAVPLLQALAPDQAPFRVFELTVPDLP